MTLRLQYTNYKSKNAKTPEDRIYCLCFEHGIFKKYDDINKVALS